MVGSCHAQQGPCWGWACTYFQDTVCSPRDKVSFILGLASVFCWGVAEVPQILTNFREQSTEGVSLAFLLTWVLGDCFNLLGCYLEPSTLPTQFYVALLYTLTTLVLVFQVIYYDHVLKGRKRKQQKAAEDQLGPLSMQDKASTMQNGGPTTKMDAAGVAPAVASGALPVQARLSTPSSPVDAHVQMSPQSGGRDRYYTSARSLASSHTPTAGSYLAGSRGAGGSMRGGNSYSLLQQNSIDSNAAATPPAHVLRAVVSSAMFVGGLNIHVRHQPKRRVDAIRYGTAKRATFVGRKLFQAELLINSVDSASASTGLGATLGMWLGWCMAAIYMGGRVPQIWLNIKRGTIEGLNPLMFTFALLGNATYVGSILVRTTEWERIQSNMPWLVDAGACVVLDFFILCQFLYYYKRKSRDHECEDGDSNLEGDYKGLH